MKMMRSTLYLLGFALVLTTWFSVVMCDGEKLIEGGDTVAVGKEYRVASDIRQQQLKQMPSTSMTIYKEPNSWIINILKELFDDIDWEVIDAARVQIVKFIHKVERIVGSFRSILNKANGSSDLSTPRDSSSFASRWWGKTKSAPDTASVADATNVKEMLERVACFVGYVRLMNLSNEALAELDASKVVTNLFGSAKRNSSAWTWFG